MALNSGIQTNQILTNDNEGCIPCLCSILLAVFTIRFQVETWPGTIWSQLSKTKSWFYVKYSAAVLPDIISSENLALQEIWIAKTYLEPIIGERQTR